VLLARLLGALEAAARALGSVEITEGGVEPERRTLYDRLGFRGRENPMTRPLLPLPGRAREALLRRAGR
jgi:hypothetical protein